MPKTVVSPLHRAVESASRILHVGGICTFDARRWHEAVLCHVHRIWDRKGRPYIDLGGVTLEFDPETDEYVAYGKPHFIAAPEPDGGARTLIVDPPGGASMRDKLGQFAMDVECRSLTVYFRSAILELWRTPDAGMLGVAAAGIPETHIVVPAPNPVVPQTILVPITAALESRGVRRASSSQSIPSA